jgi:hypothetical protein
MIIGDFGTELVFADASMVRLVSALADGFVCVRVDVSMVRRTTWLDVPEWSEGWRVWLRFQLHGDDDDDDDDDGNSGNSGYAWRWQQRLCMAMATMATSWSITSTNTTAYLSRYFLVCSLSPSFFDVGWHDDDKWWIKSLWIWSSVQLLGWEWTLWLETLSVGELIIDCELHFAGFASGTVLFRLKRHAQGFGSTARTISSIAQFCFAWKGPTFWEQGDIALWNVSFSD